jgi:ribulose 1,5-bisphosphate synthetase/thiazole synthase
MDKIGYNKEISDIIKTQVLVIGGGMAGFAAAVASARNGAKTILVERMGAMGGMATSGLVGPFMTCYDNDAKEQIVKGIFDELCIRTEKKGGAIHPSKISGMTSYSSYLINSHQHVTPFQSEILALVMDEMLLESGAKPLFYTQVADCIVKDKKIDYVVALKKEGLCIIKADHYIDCTGDADVAYFAGVETWKGDPKTGYIQPASLFFEVGGIDREPFIKELEDHKDQLNSFFKNAFSWFVDIAREKGEWTISRNELGNYEQNIPGRFKINTTRMLNIDGTRSEDLTRAIIDGRKQVQEVLAFMRKYIPGCKNVQLLQVAASVGIRESRHVKGKYLLTAEDILSRKHFDDAVVTFAYALDVHNAEDGGGVFTLVDQYYTIPYRCLVADGCDNLLVAGRCISGTSEAAASFRVMPGCAATGQAAGTAAALAIKGGVSPDKVDIQKLRSTLIDQGAVIKD